MSIESNPNPLEENVVSQIIDSSALTKYAAKERDWAKIEGYLASADSLELALIETSNALWKEIQKKEIDLNLQRKLFKSSLTLFGFWISKNMLRELLRWRSSITLQYTIRCSLPVQRRKTATDFM